MGVGTKVEIHCRGRIYRGVITHFLSSIHFKFNCKGIAYTTLASGGEIIGLFKS